MKNKPAAIALLSFVVLVVSISVGAQEPIPVSKNYAAWAQEFLRAMYPSLNDKKYALSLEAWAVYDHPGAQVRSLSVTIGEGPVGQYSKVIGGFAAPAKPPEDFHAGPQYYKQFLSSGFEFDDRDHLLYFGASGASIGNSGARNEYFGLLALHPDLTQTEVDAALRQAGFKFGPDEQQAFAKSLHIKELERFLGKIEAVAVSSVPREVLPSGVVPWVDWSVILQTSQSDGSRLRYQLFFDPFNGDLTLLHTVPQPGVPGAP